MLATATNISTTAISSPQNKPNQTKPKTDLTEQTLYSLAVRACNNKEQPKHFRNLPSKNERKKLKTLRQEKTKRERERERERKKNFVIISSLSLYLSLLSRASFFL
jgi:hypothetical protein